MDDTDVGTMLKLVDTHPHCKRWPSWMKPALSRLESYTDNPTWKRLLGKWLEFEDKLGYPYGQVRCVCL